MALNDDIEQHVQCIEQRLDQVVDCGTDEELFFASYLHGHFSVVVSQVLQSNAPSLQDLQTTMHTSLEQAFNNQELAAEDQLKVSELWRQLLNDLPDENNPAVP